MNILLVDDDSSRWVMAMFLHEAGHQVTVCSNGGDALDQLISRKFDLLMTDVQMPDMNGIDLLRRARRLPGIPAVHVIVCTAYGGQAVQELEKQGICKVLIKPIQLDELVMTLQNIEKALAPPAKETELPGTGECHRQA